MSQFEALEEKVDPDPFSLVALMFAGCSLILQFAQTAKQFEAPPPSPPGAETNSVTMLDNLRSSTTDLRTKLDRVIRSIRRGSSDANKEFFEARFRIDQAKLFLDPAHYQQFMTALSESFAATGGLSLWINHIQNQDAGLAYRLGNQLIGPLEGMASRLNEIIAHGRANQEVLEELYNSTTALLNAIDTEERRKN